MRIRSRAALAVLLLGAAADAQVLLFRLDGYSPFGDFGATLDGTGDVDGDGVPDLVIGAPNDPVGGGMYGGAAYVVSGADGSLIHAITTGDDTGAAVSGLGDIDGDGRAEFVVSVPWADAPVIGIDVGRASVHSGATGAPLVSAYGGACNDRFGVSADGGGDIDGNGVPDVVAASAQSYGVFGQPAPPYVCGFSPSPFIGLVSEPTSYDALIVGDVVDGDGRDDYLLGFDDPDGATYVALMSAKTREPVYLYPDVTGAFARLGDIDADGVPDFAILQEGIFVAVERVIVISGKSGRKLYVLEGEDGSSFGTSAEGIGDIDGDGFGDFVVGEPGFGETGRISVHSGPDGALIYTYVPPDEHGLFGYVVADAGDIDGDGTSEIAVGAPDLNDDIGAVYVLSPKPVWKDLGNGTAGALGIPELSAQGPLVAGSALELVLEHAAPAAPATLVLGLSELSVPFKGGVLVPAPDALFAGLVTDGGGVIVVHADVPAGIPAGTTFVLQHWILDATGPQGFAASNAVAGTAP